MTGPEPSTSAGRSADKPTGKSTEVSTEASAETPTGPEPGLPEVDPSLSGPQLARAMLEAAQARRPTARRRRRERTDQPKDAPRRRGWSGAGPDPRDPQPLGSVLAKLVAERGWQRPAAEARLFGEWERVVGTDVADHCRPTKLERGELTIEAESTAWATQLRLLARSLLKQIAAEVGNNVVTKLHVHGPAAPSWRRGPRRVRGPGPGDTYG